MTENDTRHILHGLAEIAGETLRVDGTLVFDVDLERNLAVGLCEWCREEAGGVRFTRDVYSLDLFSKGARFLWECRGRQESHADDPNPLLIADGSANLIHHRLGVKSLLVYPFCFRAQGYYCLIFLQIGHRHDWGDADLEFVATVARRVELAIEKINFLNERVKAEKAAREHLHFVHSLIDTIPNPIFYKDRHGRYLGCNRAYEEFTGLNRDGIVNRTVHEVHSRDLADKFAAVDAVLLNQPDSQSLQTEILRPHADGSLRNVIINRATYLDADGAVAGLVGVLVDVTAYRRAMEEVHKLSQFLSVVIDDANVWINVLDAAGNVLIWNKAAEMISGYSREEVAGHQGIWSWLYPDPAYRREILAKVAAILRGEETVEDTETVIRTRGREERVISWHSRALLDESGEPIGSVALGRDVTERKRFNREMACLDRLNLVGEMAAGIAHEIRNPMTSVRGFLQLMNEQEQHTRHRHYFELMIAELDRANAIISEFLSLTRKKPSCPSKQNLACIVESVLPLIRADAAIADKCVGAELEPVPELVVDEKEIRQLVLNLARNGLEAMAPGGRLTIRTFMDGETIVLSVRDQGGGIEPHLLGKLGTPFFTTKEQGAGLGLAVCYSIADRNGAVPEIETGPDGTTFRIRFRRQPQPDAELGDHLCGTAPGTQN